MAACQFVLPASALLELGGLQRQPGRAGTPSRDGSSGDPVAAPTLALEDRPCTSLTYSSMQVDVKDPLSTSKPLRPFDRTTFESAFPPSATSSTASSPIRSFSAALSTTPSASASCTAGSPRAGFGEDPFFYPLLPENERRRLAEFWFLTAGIHDDTSLAKHLQTLLTLVRDLYGFDIALLQFIDNDRSSSLSPDGWQGSCYPRRETGCAHTMLLEPGTVLNIDDFFDDLRFAGNPQIVSAQMRSYAGVPLAYTIQSSGESISLGSLCIMSLKEKKPPLTQAHRNSLARFANLAVQIIYSGCFVRELLEGLTPCLSEEGNASAEPTSDENRKDRMRLRREALQTKRHEHLSNLAKTTGPPSTVVQTTLETLETTFGGKASFVEAVNGCLELSNVGRIPVSAFTDDIWENGPVIEDFIKFHNHESSLDYDAGCTIRAMAVPLTNLNGHYLIVQTGHLRDVYDGSDALFVRSCGMVISGSIQDGLLRQALEAKTSFLRNVQHAFRTSLNGILSATDLLLQQDPTENGVFSGAVVASSSKESNVTNTTPLELLKIVETAGRGLLTVVNHLIDLDAQGMAKTVDVCDLHDIEEEVLDTMVQQSSLEKIRDILLVSDSHLSGSMGDCIISNRLLLKQSVAALVRNAVEATSAGGMVMINIRLEREPDGYQSLIIDVQDTGCGIAEADKERIFLPFEKVSAFSHHSGLGLAFASQYVATLGGSIKLLSSTINQGSIFQIRIPNPILASSLQTHKSRKNLPRNWSYWMNPTSISRDVGEVYGRSLRNMGILQASTLPQATLLVQPMTNTTTVKEQTETPDSLAPNQLLLMLGWEDDHHLKLAGREGRNRTVYGRLPWTRHRLVETLSQAQKVLNSHMEEKKVVVGNVPNGQTVAGKDSRPIVNIRALLVDDNTMNLNILQAYCKKRKYSFDSARDGQEAFNAYVKACENGQVPNICLLDLQMPVCDGLACATLMRDYEKKEGRSRCPIIIVTAQSGDADRQSSIEAGTDAYYVKPLRISTLDDIVARYARA